MNPTFAAALLRALQAGRNLGPRGMPVTEERVTAALEAGFIEVNGRRIPVTGHGARGLRPGAKVAVAWQRGQPTVAIRHSARRTGPVSPSPRRLQGIVEELINAPVTAGSAIRDIWFRNDTVLGRLQINTTATTYDSPRWGLSRQHILVQRSLRQYAVFTIERDPEQVLTDLPVATLEREYDVGASTIVLGQYTTVYSGFTFNPPIVLGTLVSPPQPSYNSGDGGVQYFGNITDAIVDDRGHLLISVTVVVRYFVFTQPFWATLIPYIVDMTDSVVLFDGVVECPALFGVTAHSPQSIQLNLPALPNTGTPNFMLLDPFPMYDLFFLNAADGELTLIAGAAYHWEAYDASSHLSNAKSMAMVRTPTSSLVILPLTTGTGTSTPSEKVLVVPGRSDEYVFWVPHHVPGGQGTTLARSLSAVLGTTTSGVNMTRFVDPTDTVAVSADVDTFFAPRLLLLDPTALYNTTDANDETGHFFVEFLEADGDLALNAAASGFPVQDARPGETGGFLLEYPDDLRFIQTYLDGWTEGEDPLDAFLLLDVFTAYQVILDASVVPELPI